MRVARAARVLAWIVVALAIADPAVPVRTTTLPVIRVIDEAPTEASARALAALERALEGRARLVASPVPDAAAFLAVGVRPPAARLEFGGRPVHVLMVPEGRGPVRIARAAAPAVALAQTPVAIDIELHRDAGSDNHTAVGLLDGPVTLAATMAKWLPGQESASVTLTWMPMRAGVTQVRVAATTGGSRVAADLLIDVRDTAAEVSIESARASWGIRFVEDVLREDPRLRVSSRITTAPGRLVREQPAGRPARGTAARVIVAGAPDALGGRDAERLRRAASDGATVVLVADRALSSAAAGLVAPARFVERLNGTPVTSAAGLRGAEWLVAVGLSPAARVLDRVRLGRDEHPVAVEIPVGAGHVVVVGALDAWRFRSDAAYESFWRGLVIERAGAQLSQRASLRVAPAVVRPRQPFALTLLTPGSVTPELRTVRIGGTDGNGELRTLAPVGGGLYSGRGVAPATPGLVRVSVEGGMPGGHAWLAVREDVEGPSGADEPAMRALADASHGAYSRAADDAFASAIAARLPAHSARSAARPMRWPGWVIVVALLLGVEWWGRRRAGLR